MEILQSTKICKHSNNSTIKLINYTSRNISFIFPLQYLYIKKKMIRTLEINYQYCFFKILHKAFTFKFQHNFNPRELYCVYIIRNELNFLLYPFIIQLPLLLIIIF